MKPLRQPLEKASPLAESRDPSRVREMFDGIAGRYDLLNRVLSANLDRRWRRRAIAALDEDAAATVLDLCGGTGDLSVELVRAGRAGRVARKAHGAHPGHSEFSTETGSMCAARRAGHHDARPPTRRRRARIPPKVVASTASIPKRNPSSRRDAGIATARPIAAPSTASSSPLRVSRETTSFGLAPRASRTPISGRR